MKIAGEKILIAVTIYLSMFVNSIVSIVNGRLAKIEENPWQVSINYEQIWFVDYHECGGVIIENRWILTAAHCIVDDMSAFFVRAGTVDSTWYGQKYQIKNHIKHPWYDDESYKHDVALIELTEAIQFTDTIKSIKMANENFSLNERDRVKVSGYGETCFRCDDDGKLLESHLNDVNHTECDKVFFEMSNRTICVKDLNEVNKSTPCNGDGGGPLTITDENNTAILVGIVSYGHKCQPDMPAVFSSIPLYRKWIDAVIYGV